MSLKAYGPCTEEEQAAVGIRCFDLSGKPSVSVFLLNTNRKTTIYSEKDYCILQNN